MKRTDPGSVLRPVNQFFIPCRNVRRMSSCPPAIQSVKVVCFCYTTSNCLHQRSPYLGWRWAKDDLPQHLHVRVSGTNTLALDDVGVIIALLIMCFLYNKLGLKTDNMLEPKSMTWTSFVFYLKNDYYLYIWNKVIFRIQYLSYHSDVLP